MTPSPASVLLRAAELVTERGWCQGTLRSDDGCVCMLGAIQIATIEAGGSVAHGSMYADALLAAKDQVPRWQLTDWNDAAGRTVAEVVRLLCSAAATCETWAAA